MLPMTWLLIFQDLRELEEVHVYWNVNKRTSPDTHTKDKRMQDTVSRLDSAKAAIEGFLLAFGLPHSPCPDPKENIVQVGKGETVVIWEIVRSPRRCGHHLVAGSRSASVRRVHGQKPPRCQAYPRTKCLVHSRWPGKISLHKILGSKYESGRFHGYDATKENPPFACYKSKEHLEL